jgi:hypothetical protein
MKLKVSGVPFYDYDKALFSAKQMRVKRQACPPLCPQTRRGSPHDPFSVEWRRKNLKMSFIPENTVQELSKCTYTTTKKYAKHFKKRRSV